MRYVINVVPYKFSTTFIVGEGLAPPETVPINTIKREADEAFSVGDDACDIPSMTGVIDIESGR